MSDEQPSIEAAEAEAQPEVKKGDGSVVVRLVTEIGEADIRVPPRNKWGSMSRNRIHQGDDLGWAAYTLADDDIKKWMELDPTTEEAEAFFERFNELSPVANNRAERRRHLRAAS